MIFSALNNSSGCCMIFIDEHSRIYQNWQQYLKNNILPGGIMVAPSNGIYSLNENDEVITYCNIFLIKERFIIERGHM